MSQSDARPIGVFDSGVGGLTVLKSIRERLPDENLIYLGDTARLPYGTKSAVSVMRYARRAARHLTQYDIKLLVIACNTASAVALGDLQDALAPMPVIGVIEPGARAAVLARPAARHLVLATEATVRLGAYATAIRAMDENASVAELPCEMMVALAEEGWSEGTVAEAIVRKYVQPMLAAAGDARPESLILGCTHFPILRGVIRLVVGPAISIVDSAGTTAEVVAGRIAADGLDGQSGGGNEVKLLATDGARRFARVGGAFLGESLQAGDIGLVDI
jgi:glutamate racemase